MSFYTKLNFKTFILSFSNGIKKQICKSEHTNTNTLVLIALLKLIRYTHMTHSVRNIMHYYFYHESFINFCDKIGSRSSVLFIDHLN